MIAPERLQKRYLPTPEEAALIRSVSLGPKQSSVLEQLAAYGFVRVEFRDPVRFGWKTFRKTFAGGHSIDPSSIRGLSSRLRALGFKVWRVNRENHPGGNHAYELRVARNHRLTSPAKRVEWYPITPQRKETP